ncbi:putative (di)nucleoside polyphosphate hydrolase [Rhodoligotrophos appendicifer]|uniref:RNA pyrophosphohydrolase n=1 Tax=Rhodoligotrophos appendicifer TaxID=987056 RepID=UPI001181616C|nr:RNA pyrophosphohydrolase [Rhodoligotrophos appendicifer]
MSEKLDDAQIAAMPYRPCVGIMLMNAENRVWLGKRVPKWECDLGFDLWQMPQGGIDEGENPREAAFRELFEEVGTREASIIADTQGWLHYDLPRSAIGKALHGRYRGQRQKWFLMRYEGRDSDFNLIPADGGEIEFDEWRWVDISEVTSLVVPFKRHVYEQVVATFAPLVRSI